MHRILYRTLYRILYLSRTAIPLCHLLYRTAGETDDEIIDTMVDLRGVGVDILTLGQYLQPTPHHLPVTDYVTPEKFDYW